MREGNFDKQLFLHLIHQAMGTRSINQYARESGVSATYISKLLRGILPNPPGYEIVAKLAASAQNGITLGALMKSLGFDPLDGQQPSNVPVEFTLPNYNIMRPDLFNFNRKLVIPVYRNLDDALENSPNVLNTIETWLESSDKANQYFWWTVIDDKMAPTADKGDLLLISLQETPDDTEPMVLVRVENDYPYVTRIASTKNSHILKLKTDNPFYPSRWIRKTKVQILGVIKELRRINP